MADAVWSKAPDRSLGQTINVSQGWFIGFQECWRFDLAEIRLWTSFQKQVVGRFSGYQVSVIELPAARRGGTSSTALRCTGCPETSPWRPRRPAWAADGDLGHGLAIVSWHGSDGGARRERVNVRLGQGYLGGNPTAVAGQAAAVLTGRNRRAAQRDRAVGAEVPAKEQFVWPAVHDLGRHRSGDGLWLGSPGCQSRPYGC